MHKFNNTSTSKPKDTLKPSQPHHAYVLTAYLNNSQPDNQESLGFWIWILKPKASVSISAEEFNRVQNDRQVALHSCCSVAAHPAVYVLNSKDKPCGQTIHGQRLPE